MADQVVNLPQQGSYPDVLVLFFLYLELKGVKKKNEMAVARCAMKRLHCVVSSSGSYLPVKRLLFA